MCGMRTIAVGIVIALSAIGMAACGSGNEPASPTPTATVPVTPEPTPTATEPTGTATPSTEELEAEVTQAYLAYWDAYAEALLELDVSHVEGVASDDEFDRIEEEIENLRADGVALRLVVELDYTVVIDSETSAVVVDAIVNNSFFVDPVTKEPPEGEGSGETIRDMFFLEKRDGGWTVVRSVREE